MTKSCLCSTCKVYMFDFLLYLSGITNRNMIFSGQIIVVHQINSDLLTGSEAFSYSIYSLCLLSHSLKSSDLKCRQFGGFYNSFQNLGSWQMNNPVSQVPVSYIFHSGMLKQSNRFVTIKAIQLDAATRNRHNIFSIESNRPDWHCCRLKVQHSNSWRLQHSLNF